MGIRLKFARRTLLFQGVNDFNKRESKLIGVFFCFSSSLTTLFSLNHELNCIVDYFFMFSRVFVCYLVVAGVASKNALILLEFMQFLRRSSRELSAFISRCLSSLPAEYISLRFRAAFFNILVHLFWLPFRDTRY